MIKVAHISEGLIGGICTHLCAILPSLVENGFDVTLIVSLGRSDPDAGARMEELRRHGVKVHVIPMLRGIHPLQDARALHILVRLLSRHRFDIVHTHGSKAGALGRIAAALTASPIRLHSPHCFAFLRNGSRAARYVYLGLERMLGRLTTRLIPVATSEADIAVRCRIIPRSRCTVIENALPDGRMPAARWTADVPDDSSLFAGGRSRYVVTTVCRLVNYKGVFRFLRAALLSRTPDARFLIAGDGELRAAAQAFIVEHHLEQKVGLPGYIRDMESLYARSDVVVLCSDAEGMPYCLLEAMRARCAIVATAVIGNRDLVVHNKTGVLVGPDPTEVARAIDDLLANESKRRDMGANAYIYFHEHHALKKQIAGLSTIYRSFFVGAEPWAPNRPQKSACSERFTGRANDAQNVSGP
jgi:glycosyltransferase involved in cell wall biosynthesis